MAFLVVLAMLEASGALLGGYKNIDPKTAGIRRLARFAVQTYNNQQDNELYQMVKVTSAQQQVVAGLNYKLNIVVFDENQDELEKDFSADGGSVYAKCQAVVHQALPDKDGKQALTLQSFECQ